ncbi:helicase-related protein [Streptomyces sp. NPDC050508]|uniref:helicase-related protein n=1 Tax=Streptomyces sp. NPDC050508 TaxID=3155405 RepID=UPI00343F7B09
MQITNAAERLAATLEAKRSRRSWNPDLHPRDSKGRFIETGGIARMWGGGMARVLRALGGRNVLVENVTTHQRSTVNASRLTMVARPDGSAPTRSKRKVRDEDERRTVDTRRGTGIDTEDPGDHGDTPDEPHAKDDEGEDIGEDKEGEDHGKGPEPADDDPLVHRGRVMPNDKDDEGDPLPSNLDGNRRTTHHPNLLPIDGGARAGHVAGRGDALRARGPKGTEKNPRDEEEFQDTEHARAAVAELTSDYFADLEAVMPRDWSNTEARDAFDELYELSGDGLDLDEMINGDTSTDSDDLSTLQGLAEDAERLAELAETDGRDEVARYAQNLADALNLTVERFEAHDGKKIPKPRKNGKPTPKAWADEPVPAPKGAPARPRPAKKTATPNRRKDPNRRFKTLDDVRAHWASGNLTPYTADKDAQDKHTASTAELFDKLKNPQLSRNGHFVIGEMGVQRRNGEIHYGWGVILTDSGVRLAMPTRKGEAADFVKRLEAAQGNGESFDWDAPDYQSRLNTPEGRAMVQEAASAAQKAFADKAAKKRASASARTTPAAPNPEQQAAQQVADRTGVPDANVAVGHVGPQPFGDERGRPRNSEELREFWKRGGSGDTPEAQRDDMRKFANDPDITLHLADHRGFVIMEDRRGGRTRFQVRATGTARPLSGLGTRGLHTYGDFEDQDTANRFTLYLGSRLRDQNGRTVDWGSPKLNRELNEFRDKDGNRSGRAIWEIAGEFDRERGVTDSTAARLGRPRPQDNEQRDPNPDAPDTDVPGEDVPTPQQAAGQQQDDQEEQQSERLQRAGEGVLGDVPAGGTGRTGGDDTADDVLRTDQRGDRGADRGEARRVQGGDDAGGGLPGRDGGRQHGDDAGEGSGPARDAVRPAEGARDGGQGDAEGEPAEDRSSVTFGSPEQEQTAPQYQPPQDGRSLVPTGVLPRVKANIAAIETLRRLEAENRPATAAEQETLARWSGWGATPQVFVDDPKPEFAALQKKLRELLSDKEWDAARENTLNAHYTDPAIVQGVWNAVRELGFDGGNVLEPGSGSGNFIGYAPENAEMTGVELDPITAGIAKALYPHATVRNEGFEETRAADGTFDMAIGNVPFGDYQVVDLRHNKGGHNIHNHFILKSLDLTRPGGLVAVVTSRYTMDGSTPRAEDARMEMARKADLVGAIRLPTGAHRRTAGTDVVTDLLIFRRREKDKDFTSGRTRTGAVKTPDQRKKDDPPTWVHSMRVENLPGQELDEDEKPDDAPKVHVNPYFLTNPGHVLGHMVVGHGMYGPGELRVDGDGDLNTAFDKALKKIVARAKDAGLSYTPDTGERRKVEMLPEGSDRVDGHVQVSPDGTFTQIRDGMIHPFEVPSTQVEEARQLLDLRDSMKALVREESRPDTDEQHVEALRADLKARYDAYHAKFGSLNRFEWATRKSTDPETGQQVEKAFRKRPQMGGLITRDPTMAVVLSLDSYDDHTQTSTPAAIFTKRQSRHRTIAERADSPEDAMAIVMEQRGSLDTETLAKVMGTSPEKARERLLAARSTDPDTGNEYPLVFEPHNGGDLIPAADYLSGNVREKLEQAQALAAEDARFEINVKQLEDVLPPDLSPGEIDAPMGASWLDAGPVQSFLREKLNTRNVKVSYQGGSLWKVDASDAVKKSSAATEVWGTSDYSAIKLAEAILTNGRIRVTYKDDAGNTYVDEEATAAAQTKADELREEFQDWLWATPERSDQVKKRYNDIHNNLALRSYDGQRRTMPGLAEWFKPHAHQHAAVARMVNEPAVLLAHEVGAGKTAEMTMGVMELRRLGLINKAAMVVPNHMLSQFHDEFAELYPESAANGRILAASSEDLQGRKRREFIARVATGDYDAVILTQNAFESIPMRPEVQLEYIKREKEHLETALRRQKEQDALDEPGKRTDSRMVKEIQNRLKKLEAKINAKIKASKDTAGLYFEDTGIDYVVVDEAHHYKNLSTNSGIPGAAIEGSNRASDLDMKLEYLRKNTKSGRVVTFATATPISNSVTEAHTMLRYLRPDLLEKAKVRNFDEFASTYGKIVNGVELAADGSGFKEVARFAAFRNMPELLRIWRTVADVKNSDDLAEYLDTPDVASGKAITISVDPTDQMLAYQNELAARARAVKKGDVDPTEDNMLKISSDGRKVSLDPRMVGLDEQGNKLPKAAENIARIYEETKDAVYPTSKNNPTPHDTPGGLQIVFLDMGTPQDPGKSKKKGKKDDGPTSVEELSQSRFPAYQELKDLLIERGVPAEKIRFIHEAKNDAEKARLFNDARTGKIAVLVGSTSKMGTGTNVQLRATALHHLDCPWRPADLEQRNGRIIRQGNANPEVAIFQYVTEQSFDGFSWQTVARKAKFIRQIMKGNLTDRTVEDIPDGVFNAEQVTAISTGNPYLLEQANVKASLAILKRKLKGHMRTIEGYKSTIRGTELLRESTDKLVAQLQDVIARRKSTRGDNFNATFGHNDYTKRDEAAKAFATAAHAVLRQGTADPYRSGGHPKIPIGKIGNIEVTAQYRTAWGDFGRVHLVDISFPDIPQSRHSYQEDDLKKETTLPITRLEDSLADVDKRIVRAESHLRQEERAAETARERVDRPFEQADELASAERRSKLIGALIREQSKDTTSDEAGREKRARLDALEHQLREARLAAGEESGDVDDPAAAQDTDLLPRTPAPPSISTDEKGRPRILWPDAEARKAAKEKQKNERAQRAREERGETTLDPEQVRRDLASLSEGAPGVDAAPAPRAPENEDDSTEQTQESAPSAASGQDAPQIDPRKAHYEEPGTQTPREASEEKRRLIAQWNDSELHARLLAQPEGSDGRRLVTALDDATDHNDTRDGMYSTATRAWKRVINAIDDLSAYLHKHHEETHNAESDRAVLEQLRDRAEVHVERMKTTSRDGMTAELAARIRAHRESPNAEEETGGSNAETSDEASVSDSEQITPATRDEPEETVALDPEKVRSDLDSLNGDSDSDATDEASAAAEPEQDAQTTTSSAQPTRTPAARPFSNDREWRIALTPVDGAETQLHSAATSTWGNGEGLPGSVPLIRRAVMDAVAAQEDGDYDAAEEHLRDARDSAATLLDTLEDNERGEMEGPLRSFLDAIDTYLPRHRATRTKRQREDGQQRDLEAGARAQFEQESRTRRSRAADQEAPEASGPASNAPGADEVPVPPQDEPQAEEDTVALDPERVRSDLNALNDGGDNETDSSSPAPADTEETDSEREPDAEGETIDAGQARLNDYVRVETPDTMGRTRVDEGFLRANPRKGKGHHRGQDFDAWILYLGDGRNQSPHRGAQVEIPTDQKIQRLPAPEAPQPGPVDVDSVKNGEYIRVTLPDSEGNEVTHEGYVTSKSPRRAGPRGDDPVDSWSVHLADTPHADHEWDDLLDIPTGHVVERKPTPGPVPELEIPDVPGIDLSEYTRDERKHVDEYRDWAGVWANPSQDGPRNTLLDRVRTMPGSAYKPLRPEEAARWIGVASDAFPLDQFDENTRHLLTGYDGEQREFLAGQAASMREATQKIAGEFRAESRKIMLPHIATRSGTEEATEKLNARWAEDLERVRQIVPDRIAVAEADAKRHGLTDQQVKDFLTGVAGGDGPEQKANGLPGAFPEVRRSLTAARTDVLSYYAGFRAWQGQDDDQQFAGYHHYNGRRRALGAEPLPAVDAASGTGPLIIGEAELPEGMRWTRLQNLQPGDLYRPVSATSDDQKVFDGLDAPHIVINLHADGKEGRPRTRSLSTGGHTEHPGDWVIQLTSPESSLRKKANAKLRDKWVRQEVQDDDRKWEAAQAISRRPEGEAADLATLKEGERVRVRGSNEFIGGTYVAEGDLLEPPERAQMWRNGEQVDGWRLLLSSRSHARDDIYVADGEDDEWAERTDGAADDNANTPDVDAPENDGGNDANAAPESENLRPDQAEVGDYVRVETQNTAGTRVVREGHLLAPAKKVTATRDRQRVKAWRLYLGREGEQPSRSNGVTILADDTIERMPTPTPAPQQEEREEHTNTLGWKGPDESREKVGEYDGKPVEVGELHIKGQSVGRAVYLDGKRIGRLHGEGGAWRAEHDRHGSVGSGWITRWSGEPDDPTTRAALLLAQVDKDGEEGPRMHFMHDGTVSQQEAERRIAAHEDPRDRRLPQDDDNSTDDSDAQDTDSNESEPEPEEDSNDEDTQQNDDEDDSKNIRRRDDHDGDGGGGEPPTGDPATPDDDDDRDHQDDAAGDGDGPEADDEEDRERRNRRRRRRDRDRNRPGNGVDGPDGIGLPNLPNLDNDHSGSDDDGRGRAGRSRRLADLKDRYRSGDTPTPEGANPQEHNAYLRRLADNDTLTLSPSGDLIIWSDDNGRTWQMGHAASGMHLPRFGAYGEEIGGRDGAVRLAGEYERMRGENGQPLDWAQPQLDIETLRQWRDSRGEPLTDAVTFVRDSVIREHQREAGRRQTDAGTADSNERPTSSTDETAEPDAAPQATSESGAEGRPEPPAEEQDDDAPAGADDDSTVGADDTGASGTTVPADSEKRAGDGAPEGDPELDLQPFMSDTGDDWNDRIITDEAAIRRFGSLERMRELASRATLPSPQLPTDHESEVWLNGRLVGSVNDLDSYNRRLYPDDYEGMWQAEPKFFPTFREPVFRSREAAIAELVLRALKAGPPDQSQVTDEMADDFKLWRDLHFPKSVDGQDFSDEERERYEALDNLLNELAAGRTPSGNLPADLGHAVDELGWLADRYRKGKDEDFHINPSVLARDFAKALDHVRPEDPRAAHHRELQYRAAIQALRDLDTDDVLDHSERVSVADLRDGDVVIKLKGRRSTGSTDLATGYLRGAPKKVTLRRGKEKIRAYRVRVGDTPWEDGGREEKLTVPIDAMVYRRAGISQVEIREDQQDYGLRVGQEAPEHVYNPETDGIDYTGRAHAQANQADTLRAEDGDDRTDTGDAEADTGRTPETEPSTDTPEPAPAADEPASAPKPPSPAPKQRPADEPTTTDEPAPEPEKEPEPVGGRPAEWVKVSDLGLGDLIRIEGTTKGGTARTLAGYVVDGPKKVPTTKARRVQDMYRVLVSDTPDGRGKRNSIWVMPDATAARATRDDADQVDGAPQTGADSDVLTGRIADRVPTDNNGNALFPGSVVTDDDGREGVVTGASASTTHVQFGDDRTDDTQSPTSLNVTDGGAARPTGWTADGHLVRPGNVVADHDGNMLGTVEDVDGDTASVATPQGMNDLPIVDLRVVGGVADDSNAGSKVDRVEPTTAGELNEGDVVVRDTPDGPRTARVTRAEDNGEASLLDVQDTTTGEADQLSVPSDSEALRALGADGHAPELGPDDAADNDGEITTHEPAPAVDPVTGPTVDPQLSPEERDAIADRGDAPASDPDAQQAVARLANDLPVTPDQASALADDLREGADSSTPEGRAAQRAANHLAAAAGDEPDDAGRPEPGTIGTVGVGDTIALPGEFDPDTLTSYKVVKIEEAPGGVRVLTIEDGDGMRFKRSLGSGQPLYQLPEPQTPAADDDAEQRDPNPAPDADQLRSDYADSVVRAVVDNAIQGTTTPGSIHQLREQIAAQLTPEALRQAMRRARNGALSAITDAGIDGDERTELVRSLRKEAARARTDAIRAAVRTLDDLEPLDGESEEDTARRAADLLRLIPDALRNRPEPDSTDGDSRVDDAVTGHVDDAVGGALQDAAASGLTEERRAAIVRQLAARMAANRDATAQRIAATLPAGQRAGLLPHIVAALVVIARKIVAVIAALLKGLATAWRNSREGLRRMRERIARYRRNLVQHVRTWPEARRLRRLAAATNLPGHADGLSLGDRIAHWARLLPAPGRFGQVSRRSRWYRPASRASLAAGQLPPVQDGVRWMPDRAVDGGPGPQALRHLAAVRAAGLDVDSDIAARLTAAAPELGDDPHGTVRHAAHYADTAERRLRDLQAAAAGGTPDADMEIDAARAEAQAARQEAQRLQRAYAAALPDIVRDTLAEIREMGPAAGSHLVTTPDSDPEATRALVDVSQFVPRDWLTPTESRFLAARNGDAGGYDGRTATVADLGDAGRRTAANALLAHLQRNYPDLTAAQEAFHFSRTHRGRTGARRRTALDVLLGRLFRNLATQGTPDDIVPLGLATLFSGDWYEDDDLRAFLLGLLATR